MASNHKKTTIKIDGARLKELLILSTGKTIREISLESGYSPNFISEACSKGFASSAVQNLVKSYGINREAYEVKDNEADLEEDKPLKGQISIEEITPLTREEFKVLVKEAIVEVLSDLRGDWLSTGYDPTTQTFKAFLKLGGYKDANNS